MKAKAFGILSAITASLCCLGPLVLILLGLGSLGLGAVLGRYHAYFILGAGLLLALGWGNYLKEKRSCASAHCEIQGRKMTRTVLFLASAVVLTFGGLNLYTYVKGSPTGKLSELGDHILIPVQGMSCFTCEIAVQSALKKLPGVRQAKASARDGNVLVVYDPQKTSLDPMISAIQQTGYKTSKPRLTERYSK